MAHTFNEEDAMKRMAALITHELRTPLTCIVGYLDLLDRSDLSDPVRVRAYLEIVCGRAREMARTLSELDDFGHLDAGQALSPRTNTVATTLRSIETELAIHV